MFAHASSGVEPVTLCRNSCGSPFGNGLKSPVRWHDQQTIAESLVLLAKAEFVTVSDSMVTLMLVILVIR